MLGKQILCLAASVRVRMSVSDGVYIRAKTEKLLGITVKRKGKRGFV